MAAESVPPYLRIVADIRRRIAEGELAPGARVPSTRRLAADWGVALATATKALTTLRQEGLVRARPRIGTVVAPSATAPGAPALPAADSGRPRSRPREADGRSELPHGAGDFELSRERVVRAAIAVADDEGLAALSMRGVAARLGVAAMSPYRYVDGKDDLVLHMTDTVLAEIAYPEKPGDGWRDRLESGARALWELHRAHPWLAQLGPLTRPLVLPNLIAHSEWMLTALDGLGLAPATMFHVNVLLYGHVQGVAVHLEREAQAAGATGLTDREWLDTQTPALRKIAASGEHPTFSRVVEALDRDGYDLELDELFRFGLSALLDGLTPLIEGGRTGRSV